MGSLADPLKVLLVEDDADDRLLIMDMLSESESLRFEVDWTATYDTGEEQVRQNRHDLYLFDYRLGAKTGLDLLNVAVNIGCIAPVILLTGQKADGIDIEAMRAGAADYLVKGQFNSALLSRSIRYAMERKRVEAALWQYAVQIERKNAELNAALAALREKWSEKRYR